MIFEVLHSQWAVEGIVFTNGVQDEFNILKRKKLAGAFAAAAAAPIPAIVILKTSPEEDALLEGQVQSQEDGEKAYAEAFEDGRWHEGNLAQFELDVAAGLRSRELMEIGPDDVEDIGTLEASV